MKTNDDFAAFGKRLQEIREESGVTQAELAKRLGITQVSLSRYETGERQPNFNFLRDFAVYFGVSTDYLLGLSPVKSRQGDIQAACHAVGLSDKGVQMLSAFVSKSPDDDAVLQSTVIADEEMKRIQLKKQIRMMLFENTAVYEVLSDIADLSESTLLFAKTITDITSITDRNTAKILDASKIYELFFSGVFLSSICADTAKKGESITNMTLSIVESGNENTEDAVKKAMRKIMES